jgi:hypothetical protein
VLLAAAGTMMRGIIAAEHRSRHPVIAHELPELLELQALIKEGGTRLDVRVVCEVTCGERRFPVHAICLGNRSLDVPAAGFFGGVHGLERIGAEVVIAYLRSLVMRLPWDGVLQRQLESVRLVFMPLVNPGGVWRRTRANPNGVDLMRNAPLDALEGAPFLLGGQRLSPALPWYRGKQGAAMEVESQAVCQVAEEELLARDFSIAVDCHSGFGVNDRIWFPHAHTVEPIAHLPEIHALKNIFDQTHPHHRYIFEPQSSQYLAHGDLWDHLYLRAGEKPGRTLLPLTLEMGSWLWVKKNPRQLLSRHGLFNPLLAHRQQRVLRRHMPLLDFLTRAACSYRAWVPAEVERSVQRGRAMSLWYRAGHA